jgi:hypothetical protein
VCGFRIYKGGFVRHGQDIDPRPNAVGHKLQVPNIYPATTIPSRVCADFAARVLKTVVIMERALLDQLSDAEERDLARIAETVELLADTVGKNDLAPPLTPLGGTGG